MACLLLFLHIFLFHFPSFSSSSLNFSCHHHETSALLQFKASFTINSESYYICDESLVKTATWKNGTDCCSWHGVTCDTISGHVIGLDLGCERLQGKLHPNSTLFHLSHLQTLNLSNNYFLGSHFDSKFGGFQSLTHLDLSHTYFEGEIPTQISHLSKLQSLHLSESAGLVWKEITLKRLLQNTTNLRELILDYTDMSLIRPNYMDFLFNQSSSLVTLNLYNTGLSRKLKRSFLCLRSIQELDMSFNFNLEGQIPELSCSTSLRILDLSDCSFNGEIPTMSFSNLTHLTSLSLSRNRLNGSIPSSLLTLPRLTFLYLDDNELSGRIPNAFLMSNRFQKLDLSNNKIEGELPTSLSNLQHLIHLDLSSNSFSGQIPSTLSNLQHLIYLNLQDNSLSGQIPNVFGRMTKLQQLNLKSNNLEGQIPFSLFNLNHLDTLYCSENKLEGPLPNKTRGFQEITDLRLRDNWLSATIPSSLLSLPSLLSLDLSNNRLSGNISSISSHSLEWLNLSYNKLQGNIPESIFNLANLTDLDLSSNNLSGVVDFQHFSKLQNLDSLSLSHNNQLSLTFESNVNYNFSQLSKLDLSSVNLTEFHKLSGELYCLYLSNNKLNGNIPESIFNLTNLIDLDLSSNNLSGVVDFQHFSKLRNLRSLSLSHNSQLSLTFESNVNYSFSQLSKLELSSINLTEFPIVPSLTSLDLSNNKLSLNLLVGDLSVSICNMSSLRLLNLAHNQLTGTIPQCLADSSSLQILDLQMNRFYGSLPYNFSKFSELQTLNLYGNQLEGHFPKSLSRCKRLKFLNLGSNKIEDNFPDWLQTLQNLEILVLQDNKLHGIIANLKIEHPFPSLIIFDISGNKFSGSLPKAFLKKFEAMKNVTKLKYMMNVIYDGELINRVNQLGRDISLYYDSVTVATKGIKRTWVKVPNIFVVIDLSRNKFEGEIPNVIGELHALIGLNLSHNRLSGPIPKSMGNLTNLEWLDLSSNMLTHKIPAELTNLGFLEILNLSNNHLVGEIPQGNQFKTFSNDSYEGNLGLCGFPLSKNCGPEHHSPPSTNNSWSEEKFGFGWKPVAIGYGCGFVIGIGIGYYMFLIGKPRWLVMIFGGQPKRRVLRRSRVRRAHGTTMNHNQMVQMS